MSETMRKPAAKRTAKAGSAKAQPARKPARKGASKVGASAKSSAAKQTLGKIAAKKPQLQSAAKKPQAKAAAKKQTPKSSTKKPQTKTAAKQPQAKTAAKKPQTNSAGKKPQTKSTANQSRVKASARKASTRSVRAVASNPVADAANRRRAATSKRRAAEDLFMESKPRGGKGGGKQPPKRRSTLMGGVDLALVLGIVLLAAFLLRQQAAYADFLKMRDVVDQQTFYEGTTIEGVDVSNMTLSVAMEYWRDRVEARNESRTVTFDNGATVTAAELGYTSDYESVLSAAWSAGRNGSLEERYNMASQRVANPVAYRITRRDYSEAQLDAFVEQVAGQVDRPVKEASIASFDAQTYEFRFNEAQPGQSLDRASLKASVAQAIEAGGGSVVLPVTFIQPEFSTEEVASQYGLIDYAVTNASSSSKARLNNIKLAMSIINGTCVRPGETFSFNETVGQRTVERGFRKATAYSGGDVTEQVGGGICQVSTTLFNAAVKADMEIVERHNHSLTVGYVDKGKDATVNWGNQDFKFRNTSSDNIYICCYLTSDKRVRFGIFGRLLPNGEKITLESNITEVIKAETEYQPSSFLGPGETYVLQEGKNGYKAEAYKVRWDASGNEISRELLCKSVYKVKNQIIQYGT